MGDCFTSQDVTTFTKETNCEPLRPPRRKLRATYPAYAACGSIWSQTPGRLVRMTLRDARNFFDVGDSIYQAYMTDPTKLGFGPRKGIRYVRFLFVLVD